MIQQTVFISINCDNCDKNVTYAATQQGQAEAISQNPWMETTRTVIMPDIVPNTDQPRKRVYCSDKCEQDGLSAGLHNKPHIIPSGNQDQINLAARAAARASQTTAAIKSGQGNIQIHSN